MVKEFKVCLYANEDDNYNELWKVIDEEKYFARYMYNNEGIWYYVCDPLGYRELDYPVHDDVVFIVCDEKGNEYYRHSNGQPNPLPTFEKFVKMQWDKVKASIKHNTENDKLNFWTMCFSGETVRKLEQWLISFKDSDLYGDVARDYDENWYGCWHNTEIDYTPIPGSEFSFLGNNYQFVKVHHKHDICGVEWDTFECCDNPIEMNPCGTESHPFIQSYFELGNWYDSSIKGTMYDKMTARNLVTEKLLEVFPKEKEYGELLYLKKNEPDKWCIATAFCWKTSYGKCAEMLIDRDYHIKSIDELINNIEERTKDIVFLCNKENKEKIIELYPEVYGYDYCLI